MILFHHPDPARTERWRAAFAQLGSGHDIRFWPDIGDPAEIRFLAAWTLQPGLLESLPNLELLFSLGAGIDQLDFAQVPQHIGIVRLIERTLAASMAEYVAMSVLALHRHLPDYLHQQIDRRWQAIPETSPGERRVGVMGLGEMGRAALSAVGPFGFALRGWSRTPRFMEGVETFAGPDELVPFLAGCDILVCLLPLTAETRGILNADLFAALPRGAMLISAGRGGHLDTDALSAALDQGHLARAVLDVVPVEPLPADDPLWSHPRIILTPHVAASTDAAAAGRALIANVRRHLAGAPVIGLVDRVRGY